MEADRGAPAATEMRSVVFTDLVGSTQSRIRLGEAAADEFRRVHDRLIGDAVAAHGGTVVKGLGDGILATFSAASDAVSAMVAMQQEVELRSRGAPESSFAIRVGASVGEVSVEQGDVFGVPVVEASRLCGSAAPGEILVSELVRALSRGRSSATFEPLGELALKGFAEPLATCRLVWLPREPVLAGAPTTAPFPALLAATGAVSYVGRPELLAALSRSREEVLGGACRLVLLAGEPGAGKTRTASELATVAHAAGAIVLYGRCDEDLGLSYQPMVEALDFYTANVGVPVLGRLPGELTRLVAQLPERVPGLPPSLASDPMSEQHLLFEATASWLIELAARHEVVLVIDDLHWATKPALLMLLHVLRAGVEAGDRARLLIIGTYRDTDIDRAHPLSGVIADLRRMPAVQRLAVDGLSADEVAAFVEVAAGRSLDEPTRRLAALVFAETEGNPFFVAEVLRHLVETGAVALLDGQWVVANPNEVSIPEGVRDVVGRRVSRLSADANRLLSLASVVGRDVDVQLLAAVAELGDERLLDALDEAVRARLVEEVGPDQFRFAHALVRATLYEELSATRRRREHRRVGHAIEKLRPDDVVALTHHFMEAGPDGGERAKAIGYALAAADQALQTRALADADARFRGLLEALDDLDFGPTSVRIAALCGLGECQRDQGNPAYRQTLLDASRLALGASDVELLVRAVFSNHRGVPSIVGASDTERLDMAEAALVAVGPTPSPGRARVLAALASETTFSGDQPRRLELVAEAESIARAVGDPALLATVLNRTAFAALSLGRAEPHLVRCLEAAELAGVLCDPTQQLTAWILLASAYLTVGDLPACRERTAQMATLLPDVPPTYHWYVATNEIRCLLFDGRLAEASQRNDSWLAFAQALEEPDAPVWWGALDVGIHLMRGEIAARADGLGAFAAQYPDFPAWRLAHISALAAGGRVDEARALLDATRVDPRALLDDPFPGNALVLLSFAAHALADADLAGQVAAVLLPYRHFWAHYNLFSLGPVSFALGLCALAGGDADGGVEALEEAFGAVLDAGYEGLVPLVVAHLCEALLARNGAPDRPRAKTLLTELRRRAEAIGAPVLVGRAEEMAASIGGP